MPPDTVLFNLPAEPAMKMHVYKMLRSRSQREAGNPPQACSLLSQELASTPSQAPCSRVGAPLLTPLWQRGFFQASGVKLIPAFASSRLASASPMIAPGVQIPPSRFTSWARQSADSAIIRDVDP